MASTNPFDLLVDDDTDDVSQLIAKKALATPTVSDPKQDKQQAKQQPKLPSKPLPPAQAVREAKTDGRGGGRGGGRGFARGRGGGGGFNREPRDFGNNENAFSNGGSGLYGAAPDGDLKSSERRSGYVVGGSRGRGGRRGGYSSGEGGEGERPRRVFERRSGTGRGNDFKRDGAGRGNWGTNTDEVTPDSEEVVGGNDKIVSSEKQPGEEEVVDANKESTVAEAEEKEPEDKEMTLEEYEKVLEEKRKALQALKTEERKVDVKEFASMQQISSKKTNDEIFIKLGSDKDKRKEIADKEERAKKSVSINEFLKPAEGGKHYGAGGRGRGRGRGGARGGYTGGNSPSVPAPSIADQGQFPTLGGK